MTTLSMMPKWVLLWTDAVLWLLVLALVIYGWRVARDVNSRATWSKVGRNTTAMCAGVVLLFFTAVALLDSVHFRRAMPPVAGSTEVFYETRTESVLDALLARQWAMRETQYSAPMSCTGFAIESLAQPGGDVVRDYPRLDHGCAHLSDPSQQYASDVTARVLSGLVGAALSGALLLCLMGWALRGPQRSWHAGVLDVLRDRTRLPWRAVWFTFLVMFALLGPVLALMDHYHVMGTDRTGNDVWVQALKSIRTAFVIGTTASLATLPLAVGFGVLAGYFKGWVDEAVQYLYTVLSSVPSVLLIAACVLMVQVYIDQNIDAYETGLERSDLKVFLLCIILGLTGWATLCRMVRAETLKLRELDFVAAATAFGVSHWKIMWRHIAPNVMHLVLITTVLGFSDLILYEAVLTYVGVGVDPSTSSFGGMINLARSEMSRDPVVWWSFLAAFGFMVALVLAANLFADGVRDAFDPRARLLRPRWTRNPSAPSAKAQK